MRGGRIASVNAALPELHRTISVDPVVSEKCRLGVVSFNTDARTDLPLSNLAEVVRMPTLAAGGQTRYSAGLTHVMNVINADLGRLLEEGSRVLRPCVFFVSDGRPTDAWKTRRDQMVNRSLNPFAPNIVTYGVADADVVNLKRLSTRFTLRMNETTDPGVALAEVFRSIASSVVASTRAEGTELIIRSAGDAMEMFDNEAKQH